MTNFSGKGRSRLLLTVGTAMAVSMIATGAQAAETDVTPSVAPPPPVATGLTNNAHDIITTVQKKSDSTDASLTDSVGGVDTTDTDITNDPVDATSVLVDSNSKTASATANTLTSTIDLAVVPPAGEIDDGDGAATLGVQENLGPVSSTASGDEIDALLQNFSLGTVAVTNNTIEADTNGNSGSTLLQGELLPEYASSAAGASQMTFEPSSDDPDDWLDATGGLVASTLQIQSNPDDGISDTATASGNAIDLSIINTVDDAAVLASPTLSGNAVSATVAGNSSNSTINVEGGAATLAGSAVISNGQLNLGGSAESSINATNEDSDVVATIAADDVNTTDDAQFEGKLEVSGNTITSNASGNQALGATQGQAGNSIKLADGMSFAGSGGDSTPGADIAYNSGDLNTTVTADLAVHNSQGNVGAGDEGRMTITGSTDDGEIAAVVDDIDGGSVAVSGNAIAGTASGNAASSAIATGADMASFSGSAAVANQQTDYYTNVLAEGTGDIYASVTDTGENELPDSTVSVDDNKVAANAYGNSVSQSLSLDAAAQTLPLSGVTLTGGTGPDGNVSGAGSATVTNLQSGYSSNVNAREVHNVYVTAGAEAVDGSSLGVTGNTGEAVALGNSGSNELTLSGTNVGAGAGIASVQTVDGAGSAGAAAAVSASSAGVAQLNVDGDVDSTSAELSGNLQRGIAYGNSVSNTLNVDAQKTTVDGAENSIASSVIYYQDADDGLALDHDTLPSVEAAYGTLNDQSLNGDVTAEALPADWTGLGSSFAITAGDDVAGATLVNGGHVDADTGAIVGGNALVAAAYGADASDVATLDVGDLDTSNGNFASVANLTNVQTMTPASNVSAHAEGPAAALTSVGDDVSNSSISTSYNMVQALAYGNRAASHQTISGGNIDTEADSFPTGTRGRSTANGLSGGATQVDASFSVNNAQFAGGSIGASLVTEDDPNTTVGILTTIGDDVTNSTITSNGNTLSSGATGNRADNLSDVSGNGLATTNALANMQFVAGGADITSAIGVRGGDPTPFIPGQPEDPFDFAVTGEGLSHTGSAFTAGTLFVDDGELTSDEIAYLETQGWSPDGPNTLSRDADGYAATAGEYADLSEGGSMERGDIVPATSDTPATPGTPNVGGVTIAIGGDIDPSTVSVNGNTVSGSVTGNSAANAVSLSGTDVADGSDHLATWGIVDSQSRNATALGDEMLSNVQVVDVGANLTSDVYNTFAIDTTDGVDIADSTLTVDGNSQSSRAVANTAGNSVTLDANNTAAGASLVSFQDGRGPVGATSDADIYAPVASSGSRVSMSDNSNLAVGVMNDATNTLTVDTNSASYVTFANQAVADVSAVDDDLNSLVVGDHVLLNQQRATDDSTVSANATTSIYNDDLADSSTTGIVNGTVTVTGNNTMAEASANRAVNTANVSAGSSLTASTGVANTQVSAAQVASTATTSADITLAGDAGNSVAALNGGNVTVGGNTITALARGNAATNALNYSAGANYGTGAGNGAGTIATVDDGVIGAATAQAVVLNVQSNTGPVSASSTDATYGVALNGAGGFPVVTGGTVGVIGNNVSAAAYGNTASNSLALNSLNTGMPTGAVANYQSNSGSVMASVTAVSYGVTSGLGAVSGSALAVTGNAVTATAVGNSAVSTIGAGL